jgi:hypothetical protein
LVIGEEEAAFSRSVGILPTSSILVGRCGLAAPILMAWREVKEIREEGLGG